MSAAETADAIVVGGGIVGASAFFHLSRLGLRRVVLCERRRPGAGATGASGAFVQYHFCQNEAEARLTQASLPYFERWDELVGAGDCGFVPCGYLRLEPEERADILRERVAMLRPLGIDSQVVLPADVARLAPYLRTEGVAVAAWEPASGYADARGSVAGLLAAARRHGAEVREDTEVTGFRTAAGRVTGVETSRGPIESPIVVVAAGAWTGSLLARVQLRLPVTVTWTQVTLVGVVPRAGMVTVGDGISRTFFHALGDRILVGIGSSARRSIDDPDAREQVPAELNRDAARGLSERLRGAEGAHPVGDQSGPITVTPDDLPIIDRHPELDGLVFFAGDCGSSFKTAPAIGSALADWAVTGAPALDAVHAFDLNRFAASSAGA